jgi:uncharacterized protein (DUF305 family)
LELPLRRLLTPILAAAFVCFVAGTAAAQTAPPPNNATLAAGQATTQGQRMTDHDADSPGTKEPPPSPATKAYKAAALQMHKDMAVRYSGNADKDFAATMAAHHKGALEMAKVELKYGTDPEMRKLAEKIVAGDEKEIEFMRAWLAKQK